MSVCRGQLQITSSGFQFLLHTPHAQLWELLLQYLQMVEVRVQLSCPVLPPVGQYNWDQTPGKANGPRRGAQLFVHVIDNGAWTSKACCASPTRRS
jgi:hypothetical protein